MSQIYVFASHVPEVNRKTITSHKPYHAFDIQYFEDGSFCFKFIDDTGDKRFSSQKFSSHLDHKDWNVVKTEDDEDYPFVNFRRTNSIMLKEHNYGLFLCNNAVFFKEKSGVVRLLSNLETVTIESDSLVYPLKEI